MEIRNEGFEQALLVCLLIIWDTGNGKAYRIFSNLNYKYPQATLLGQRMLLR